MGIGIFLFLWVAYYIFKSITEEDKPESQSFNGARVFGLVIWLIAFLALTLSLRYDASVGLAVPAVALLVMFPSIWIKLPIKLGWITPSYYLSFTARIAYGQSMHARAAFNAYQAMLNKPGISEELRRTTLSRLRSKVMRSEGNITSNDMLACILFDTDKGGPETTRLLESVYFLRRETVSQNMIRFAFARLMASALAEEDWQKVAFISNRWRSKWRIPLASLIEACYHRQMKTRPVNPVAFRYLWLHCGCPKWLDKLPLPTPEDGTVALASSREEIKRQVVLKAFVAKSPTGDTPALEQLLPSEQLEEWEKRAQALHCRDPQAALDTLVKSLTSALGNSSAPDAVDDSSEQVIDEAMTRLRYQVRSIYRRQTSRRLQAGSVEFQEWLNLMSLYEQLAVDCNDRFAAYSLVESVVWNWMADLWNRKRERQLAFFICGYMNPDARKFNSEASEVYEQVLKGKLG
ncbi:hypothetical protein ACJJIF_13805 [Microbulbifer sp. SSSA002]|uniref:hypothetical protein n=1 Tax=Microbulbifer sp. SSSA002 TaxID=3243376 RepID=UPI00403A2D65